MLVPGAVVARYDEHSYSYPDSGGVEVVTVDVHALSLHHDDLPALRADRPIRLRPRGPPGGRQLVAVAVTEWGYLPRTPPTAARDRRRAVAVAMAVGAAVDVGVLTEAGVVAGLVMWATLSVDAFVAVGLVGILAAGSPAAWPGRAGSPSGRDRRPMVGNWWPASGTGCDRRSPGGMGRPSPTPPRF